MAILKIPRQSKPKQSFIFHFISALFRSIVIGQLVPFLGGKISPWFIVVKTLTLFSRHSLFPLWEAYFYDMFSLLSAQTSAIVILATFWVYLGVTPPLHIQLCIRSTAMLMATLITYHSNIFNLRLYTTKTRQSETASGYWYKGLKVVKW